MSGVEEHPLRVQMRALGGGAPAPGTPLPLPQQPFFHLADDDVDLSIEVDTDGLGVVASVTFGTAHEGAVGLVHGGMINAVVDHLSGAAGSLLAGPVVTRELTVRFHRPTWIGRSVGVRTRAERRGDGDLDVVSTCTQDGKVVATAVGHFVPVPIDRILDPRRSDGDS